MVEIVATYVVASRLPNGNRLHRCPLMPIPSQPPNPNHPHKLNVRNITLSRGNKDFPKTHSIPFQPVNPQPPRLHVQRDKKSPTYLTASPKGEIQ